jgi:Zn-dependent M28 family amino/carboxypeptidase
MAREESAAVFPTDLHGNITINASSECYPMHTENVIGIVEGTDKKDEAVVVVAHYDHVGKQEGKLYPGADDNASGTAAVMEVAEAFAQSALAGQRPRRTVIFLAVSAEEIGLFGSKYYSENPVIPLDRTFACINIDMIGRVGSKYKGEPMYVGGSAYVSQDIFTIAQQYNSLMAPGLKDIMEFSPQVRGGSDHYYFAEAGIPSLFYFTGIHKDYHSPADTPDKVLYERMEMIVKAIFGTAWHLANAEEGLKVED